MTDKHIIIDGVDVSKCEWFGQIDLDINIICTLNSPKKCSGYCKDNPNCVYKQLKRKEKECERLTRDYFKQNEWLQEQKKELDQLKEEIDKKELIFAGIETSNKLLIEKNNKLKQTLTEIKEIAEIINDRTMVASYICDHLDKILQKISECEVKND